MGLTRDSSGKFRSLTKNAKNPFFDDLESIYARFDSLATTKDAEKVAEWAFSSSAWKILKEIRKPEAAGGWPIDTKTSWKKWGFERIKSVNGKVRFIIYNDATKAEGYAAKTGRIYRGKNPSEAYAPFVYAKGDGFNRTPIAPGILKRAIIATEPTIESNFYQRLSRFLKGKSKL